MIHIGEKLIPLAELGNHVPKRRGGKKLHVATAHRWASVGLRGVRLETVRVGGTRCTSLAALGRFYEALSHAAESPPIPTDPSLGREQAIANANRELEKLGV